MEEIYANVDHDLSNIKHDHNSDVSDHTDLSVRKRNISASKESLKFLLVALGLLLLCALVGICVLGILYYNKGISFESLNEQHTSVVSKMSAQELSATELKSQLDQVQLNYTQALKHLDSVKELKSQLDQVQMNYTQAVKRLDSAKETEREYEVLKVKFNAAHKVISNCSECQKCKLCEAGWRSLGLKCYYFSADKLNWTNSRDYCAENGAHLVIITSQDEQKFVSSSIREHHWIGLNDLETEGKWMWVNNKSLTETGVEFWYKRKTEKDEPDNWTYEDPSGENCGSLGNESGDTNAWFDASCLKLKKYICEK